MIDMNAVCFWANCWRNLCAVPCGTLMAVCCAPQAKLQRLTKDNVAHEESEEEDAAPAEEADEEEEEGGDEE